MRSIEAKVQVFTGRVALGLGCSELEVRAAGIPEALTALLHEQDGDAHRSCAAAVKHVIGNADTARCAALACLHTITE